MSNNSTNDDAFNIGKSFGLEGDHKPLDNYQKLTKELNEHFAKNVQESFTQFKADSLALKSTFADLSKQTENDVVKLRNKSSELITYLLSLMKTELKNNQWLDGQVQELFKNAIVQYNKALLELFEIESRIGEVITTTEQKLDKHIEVSEQHLKAYLTDLKNKYTDLQDMEAGYQFGLALRTALDIGN